jgi:hypothetical protein
MDGGDHPDFSTPKIGKISSGKKEKRKKKYAMDTALKWVEDISSSTLI